MSEGFDFGNARVRARRARLLGADTYHLLVTLDVDRLLATLSDTPYRADLEAAVPRYRGLRLLDEALRTNLGRELREVASWYDGEAGSDLTLQVSRWDLRNMRAILRGQHSLRDPNEIRSALVPAGPLSDGVLAELARQPSLRATVELMVAWGVPSHDVARAVAAALPDLELTGDYQALERALERAEAARLAHALDQAGPEVTRMLRAEIDAANLLTALRLVEATSGQDTWDTVDPEERLLPGGTIPTSLLARVARAEDRAVAIVALGDATTLPAAWRPALTRWEETGDLVALGDALDEARTRTAAGMFATADPLGPGVALAYTAAKENEARNLRAIGAGLAAGLEPDLIEDELVLL